MLFTNYTLDKTSEMFALVFLLHFAEDFPFDIGHRINVFATYGNFQVQVCAVAKLVACGGRYTADYVALFDGLSLDNLDVGQRSIGANHVVAVVYLDDVAMP